jgi:hypothetical protein
MADLAQNFAALTDSEMIVTVVTVFAAFVAPLLYGSALEGIVNRDLPNELFGIAQIVAAEMAAGDYKRDVQIGSGLYTVDQLAARFGVQDKIRGAL